MEHAAAAPGWAITLQESAFAFAIRDSTWIYPTANLLHILGLALLIGSILMLDLRVLGIGRSVTIEALSRVALPFSLLGIGLSLGSGAILFSADAAALAGNPIFRLKMLFLAAGMGNALLFRLIWQRRIGRWSGGAPLGARLQAGLSGLGWLAVASLRPSDCVLLRTRDFSPESQ